MGKLKSAIAVMALCASAPLFAETPPPPADALDLAREVAGHGTLATLIPLMAQKEAEELIGKYPELSGSEQGQLRAIATAKSQAKLAELVDAQAAIYAQEMSRAELQTLADFVRSAAAKRQNDLQPKLIIGSMAVLDGVDFKKDVMAEICAQTGKGCDTDKD